MNGGLIFDEYQARDGSSQSESFGVAGKLLRDRIHTIFAVVHGQQIMRSLRFRFSMIHAEKTRLGILGNC